MPCRRRPRAGCIDGPVVVRSGRSGETTRCRMLALRCAGRSLAARGWSRKARRPTARSNGRPNLPPGVYRLRLSDAAGSVTEEAPLISAPAQAFGGDFDRGWLLAVQLYGVRSTRNWGIGRFHRSRRPDRAGAPVWGRWRRPQSAARAVRRPARRLQPLFAEQPAVSQRALCRCRKASGISPGRPE